MPIAQFEGKALVFNNGVVDVVQGETSLVDENKVAHIPEGGNVEIDNLTIIKNADDELEVPFDNNTIYRDQDGFIKARSGGGSSYSIGDGLDLVDNTLSVRKDDFISKSQRFPGMSWELHFDEPISGLGSFERYVEVDEDFAENWMSYWFLDSTSPLPISNL